MGDRGEVDARTDVYGLGAILFQILTGRPPLLAETASIPQALMQLMNGKVPHAATIAPWVPPALDAICARAMDFDKDKRHQTAALLAGDVRRWLVGGPGGIQEPEPERPWYRRLAGRLALRRPGDPPPPG